MYCWRHAKLKGEMMMSGTKPATRSTIEQQAWAVAWLVWAHQPRHPKHAGNLLENIWPLAARGRISASRKHFMLLNCFLHDGSTAARSFPRICHRVWACIFCGMGRRGAHGKGLVRGECSCAAGGCSSDWVQEISTSQRGEIEIADKVRARGPRRWETPIRRPCQRSVPPACGGGTLVPLRRGAARMGCSPVDGEALRSAPPPVRGSHHHRPIPRAPAPRGLPISDPAIRRHMNVVTPCCSGISG